MQSITTACTHFFRCSSNSMQARCSSCMSTHGAFCTSLTICIQALVVQAYASKHSCAFVLVHHAAFAHIHTASMHSFMQADAMSMHTVQRSVPHSDWAFRQQVDKARLHASACRLQFGCKCNQLAAAARLTPVPAHTRLLWCVHKTFPCSITTSYARSTTCVFPAQLHDLGRDKEVQQMMQEQRICHHISQRI